jgi:fructoselysine-6-P-deglycase FrlB-like protein
MPQSSNHTGNGRALIDAEMARQHDDALRSLAANTERATAIAASIRKTGRLALLGMGGSHWVNRTAAFLYRDIGVEVQAEPLSEALFAPLPARTRTVILTSQSGGSGEIGRYLDLPARLEERFGLTLNENGALAKRAASLIGAGGVEKAFAATRSILISQALHLSVLAALGYPAESALDILKAPPSPSILPARDTLAGAGIVILSGRSVLQGVAESGALCLMELARIPTYAFEGGQFRHGPMELLSEKTGVILLRPPGEAAMLAAALAASCREAGCPVAVFDCSGEPPIADGVTIRFPALHGMAAGFAILPALQRLLIEMAEQRVPQLGVPLRSSKVTTAL